MAVAGLLCAMLSGCGNTEATSDGVNSAAAEIESVAQEQIDLAHDKALEYYDKLGMEIASITLNENMEEAHKNIDLVIEQYGEGNVLMFDVILQDDETQIRHPIMTKDQDAENWGVMSEILEATADSDDSTQSDDSTTSEQ